MPAREGVGGVLPAGPGASAGPQRQLQPGQSLHHEAHHQLPADEETSQQWSVGNSCTPLEEIITFSQKTFVSLAALCGPSWHIIEIAIHLYFIHGGFFSKDTQGHYKEKVKTHQNKICRNLFKNVQKSKSNTDSSKISKNKEVLHQLRLSLKVKSSVESPVTPSN